VTITNTVKVLSRSTTINSSLLKPIFIVPVIAVLLGAIPTTVFAQSDDQQQQQTCSDGSQPDDNGNCPSLHDQLCNAYHSDAVQALIILLPLAHLLTAGTSATKVVENCHRYLQIAFAEELYLYCQANDINFLELRDSKY
jgi:hypothetical protein